MSFEPSYSIYTPFNQNYDACMAEYMEKSELLQKIESFKTNNSIAYFEIVSLDCVEDPSLLHKVFEVYAANKTLSGFCIRAWKLTVDQWKLIFDFLKSNPQIKILVLALNTVEAEVFSLIAELFETNSDLSEVKLELYFLEQPHVEALTKGLSQNKGISSLYVKLDFKDEAQNLSSCFFTGIALKQDLSHLVIEDTYLDQEGTEALCAFIESNPSLINLDILQADLNDEKIIKIKQALSKHCNLQRFSVNYNKQMGAGASSAISELIPNLPKLILLTLSSFNIPQAEKAKLFQAIQSQGKIEGLNLAAVDLNDEDLDALLAAVKQNQNLKSLKLNMNAFSQAGLIKICEVVKACGNLQEIGFTLDSDEDEGMDALLAILKDAKHLRNISVYNKSNEIPCKEKIKEIIEANQTQ